MKVIFIRGAEQGEAEYDHSTETYSWSYDGDDPHIEEMLSSMEDGKVFTEWVTSVPDDNGDDDVYTFTESQEFTTWDEHIEELAQRLERNDFNILYLGE